MGPNPIATTKFGDTFSNKYEKAARRRFDSFSDYFGQIAQLAEQPPNKSVSRIFYNFNIR
jgi:hypothetical protein